MKNTNRTLTFVLMMITWMSTALPASSQKLYKKDLKYYFELDGEAVKISEKEFKFLMAENEKALTIYNQSRKLSSFGSLGIAVAIPVTISGLAKATEKEYGVAGTSSDSRMRGQLMTSAGILVLFSGVFCKILSNEKFEKSMKIYNGSKGFSDRNQKWNMKIQFQPTGIGFVCSF